MVNDEMIIENLIYEIKGKQVVLDSEVAVTQIKELSLQVIVTHYDIVKTIPGLIKNVDASAKSERN